MCRLASLLRRFRLQGNASATDLRQAYFREAKRLHPDCQPVGERVRAEQEFVRLRADFDEALRLLETGGYGGADAARHGAASQGAHQAPWQWSSGWESSHAAGGGARWSSSQWSASSGASSAPGNAASTAVPVVGLAPEVVYPAVGGLLVVAMLCLACFWLHEAEDDSGAPTATNNGRIERLAAAEDGSSVDTASERGSRPGSTVWLRRALEDPGFANLPRAASTAQHDKVIEQLMRADGALGAAHAAAAGGRVWWLERCAASQHCHFSLALHDVRGDTPLHHCARHGQVQACRTLLRLGADPSRRNRWNLAPEHLAMHGGHAEAASLLRGARCGHADQLVARHPDGLGIAVPEAREPGRGARSSKRAAGQKGSAAFVLC